MTSALIDFHTPPQDLSAPTQFAASAKALGDWLNALPKTNLGQTARGLYQAVTELNRVRMAPAQRLQLLEVLRPAVYYAAGALSRHYLNRPMVLAELPQKAAQLSHVLFEQLATGYILVATQIDELGRQSGFSQPHQAMATAIHRAMAESSQNLLRDCQLYRSAHPGCWQTIHQLARLAATHSIEQVPVSGQPGEPVTIEAIYLRALLLGGAKTYQLRQEDLARLFARLPDWTSAVSFCAPEQALLVFDPNSDQGPMYREFAALDGHWRGLDTEALAQQLLLQRAQAESQPLDRDLSSDLLGHLVHAWSTASKRAFLRIEINEHVQLALGLTATHHFVSGELDFELLLNENGYRTLTLEGDSIFPRRGGNKDDLRATPDVWDRPYMPTEALTQVSLETIDYHLREQHLKASAKEREKFRSHTVDRVNISPGGLCVKWPPDNTSQVRAGEIVGICENSHKNWSIGVIRWLRLLETGPQLGIELLSPTATPYGARVLHKTGPHGEYLRVLVLPETRQTGQPTTLITPRLPFRVGQKVSLLCRDKETRIQLTRKIASTAAFSQFEFRRLSGAPASAESSPAVAQPETGFEGLWDNL